jgi:hypothetical protein
MSRAITATATECFQTLARRVAICRSPDSNSDRAEAGAAARARALFRASPGRATATATERGRGGLEHQRREHRIALEQADDPLEVDVWVFEYCEVFGCGRGQGRDDELVLLDAGPDDAFELCGQGLG